MKKTSHILSGNTPLVVHLYYSMNALLKEAAHCVEQGYFSEDFSTVLGGMCFKPLTSSISVTLSMMDAKNGMHSPNATLGEIISVAKFGSFLPMEFLLRYAEKIFKGKREKHIILKTKPLPLLNILIRGHLLFPCLQAEA